MPADPWTDPDPQPGDFDADLRDLDHRHVDRSPGDPDARLTILSGHPRSDGADELACDGPA